MAVISGKMVVKPAYHGGYKRVGGHFKNLTNKGFVK